MSRITVVMGIAEYVVQQLRTKLEAVLPQRDEHWTRSVLAGGPVVGASGRDTPHLNRQRS